MNTSTTPSARARTTDPKTSHDAAATVDVATERARVLSILADHDALTDEEIEAIHMWREKSRGWGPSSASGLRSRRAELVREGLVVERDRLGTTKAGRRSIRWAAVETGDDA